MAIDIFHNHLKKQSYSYCVEHLFKLFTHINAQTSLNGNQSYVYNANIKAQRTLSVFVP